MVKSLKRIIKAMKKQPTQTLLMMSILLVFVMMMVQVCRRDPQVEKLDFLKNLFGLGKDPPKSTAISTTSSTARSTARSGSTANGSTLSTAFGSTARSGSTANGSTLSTAFGSTARSGLLHHYDFSTGLLTEQVSGDTRHTLEVMNGVGGFEELGGELWYRLNKMCRLETTSLPPMPTTGNYTTQMEFWSDFSNIGDVLTLDALWGRFPGNVVGNSDYTQLQLYRFENSIGNPTGGFMKMHNQSRHPPHEGESKYSNNNGYRNSPTFAGNSTWDDGTPFTSHSGRHVLTGAYNFNQEGTDLIASIGKVTLYLDNKKVIELPIHIDMKERMMFLDGILKIESQNDQPNYIKHIRVYDHVIDQQMLNTLTSF
jgi:hypothetical protein